MGQSAASAYDPGLPCSPSLSLPPSPMLLAAFTALSDILSPPLRAILWKSVGLALVLVAVLAIALQRLLSWFAGSGEVWLEAALWRGFHPPLTILGWIVSIAAGLGVVVGAVFLMPAITALVASV